MKLCTLDFIFKFFFTLSKSLLNTKINCATFLIKFLRYLFLQEANQHEKRQQEMRRETQW